MSHISIAKFQKSDFLHDHLLRYFRLRSRFHFELLAEFFGTFCLMAIGSASIAAFILHPNYTKEGAALDIEANGTTFKLIMPPPAPTPFAIATGFSTGAMVGMYASLKISGGHINPAVTIAVATLGKCPWYKVLPYSFAQTFGAFLGCFPTYYSFSEAIEKQHEYMQQSENSSDIVAGNIHSTGSIYSTFLNPHASNSQVFLDQIIATAFLLFGCMAITDEKNLGVSLGLQPFIIAWLIRVIAMVWGVNSGNSLNPARDFGPRLFMLVMGYGLDAFKQDGYYWLTGGIIGPIIGAIVGVWSYEILFAVNSHLMPYKLTKTWPVEFHED